MIDGRILRRVESLLSSRSNTWGRLVQGINRGFRMRSSRLPRILKKELKLMKSQC